MSPHHPLRGHRYAGRVSLQHRQRVEAQRDSILARYLEINVRYSALVELNVELHDLALVAHECLPSEAAELLRLEACVEKLAQSLDRECVVLAKRLRASFHLGANDLFEDPGGELELVSRCHAAALRYLDGDGTLAALGLRLHKRGTRLSVCLDGLS